MFRQSKLSVTGLVVVVFAVLVLVHCSGSSPTDPGGSGAVSGNSASGTANSDIGTGDPGTSDPGDSDPGADDPGTGDPGPDGDDPKVTDDAGIDIEKSTNGEDADSPPGPSIPVGAAVEWTYQVTNTGDADLVGVTVTDTEGVLVDCPTDFLAIGTFMTCTGEGTADPGQYSNVGIVEAPDPNNPGSVVSDQDSSHYFGEEATAGIDIEKSTNGEDADDPPGPAIPAGEAVLWEYLVTNDGGVALVGIVVTDDQEVPVSCPTDSLDVGEFMTCTANGVAEIGQYANVGRAEAPDPADPTITVFDEDASHYFGEEVLDCTQAYPSTEELWPANHKMEYLTVEGVGSVGALTITIDSIFQDEPVNGTGDGDTWPDGEGVGTSEIGLRAERAGGLNGRVYHVAFTADNGMGSTCSGEVLVSVPKSRSKPAVDDGALYDSTAAP